MSMINIQKVTCNEAHSIVETRVPRGLFYLEDGDVIVGIDNSTGDAWVEEFSHYKLCENWLRRYRK